MGKFFLQLFRRSSKDEDKEKRSSGGMQSSPAPPAPPSQGSPASAQGKTASGTAVPSKRPPLSVSIREQLVDIHARAAAEGKKAAQDTKADTKMERIVDTESDAVEVEQKQSKMKFPRLQNIFASPLDLSADYVLPVHAKSKEQSDFIRNALADNFVFDSLQPAEMKTLINAFEHYSVPNSGTTIITQGEVGDYFYILERGSIAFYVNGAYVGEATSGQTFGELALLYNCPRAATCTTTVADASLWRVDQETFRRIVASHAQSSAKETLDLLRQVDILANHLDDVYLNRLVDAVSVMTFDSGQSILRKGDPGRAFYILKSGKIKITDIEVGGIKYEDNILDTPGAYLGERALLTDEPRVGNAFAVEDKTMVLCIPMADFNQMLGPYKELALKSNDIKILRGIPTFARSTLTSREMTELSHRIEPDTTINDQGTKIYERNHTMSAAIYIVRSGSVKLVKDGNADDSIISAGGYFGLESIFAGEDDVVASITAVALDTPVIIAKLSLASILSVALDRARLYRPDSSVDMNTKKAQDAKLMRKSEMLKPISMAALDQRESVHIRDLDDLVKHRILGRGTFGRVWLVTAKNSASKKLNQPFALKVQYKRELLSHRQDAGVIREKQIMESLDHPFIIRLVSSFQDDTCVYMLLSLVQGGELYSLMDDGTKLPEKTHAKFFSAAILESLGYLHHRSILYRDLKPENVLIGVDGYPVLVDLGFAKIVKDKSYTLCGTPLYLAPEVILSRGHDKGCDYWSWAVLLFEMILGRGPFYKSGMDQISLFKSIVQGKFSYYPEEKSFISSEAMDLIGKVLIVKPSLRFGNLPGGDETLKKHPFYADFDHAKLVKKELKAPYIPKVKDAMDASAFESWKSEEEEEKKMKKKLAPLTKTEQDKFRKFDELLQVDDDAM